MIEGLAKPEEIAMSPEAYAHLMGVKVVMDSELRGAVIELRYDGGTTATIEMASTDWRIAE